jgi:hypothetical protein
LANQYSQAKADEEENSADSEGEEVCHAQLKLAQRTLEIGRRAHEAPTLERVEKVAFLSTRVNACMSAILKPMNAVSPQAGVGMPALEREILAMAR